MASCPRCVSSPCPSEEEPTNYIPRHSHESSQTDSRPSRPCCGVAATQSQSVSSGSEAQMASVGGRERHGLRCKDWNPLRQLLIHVELNNSRRCGGKHGKQRIHSSSISGSCSGWGWRLGGAVSVPVLFTSSYILLLNPPLDLWRVASCACLQRTADRLPSTGFTVCGGGHAGASRCDSNRNSSVWTLWSFHPLSSVTDAGRSVDATNPI